jgi:hypothetical protein
LAINLPWFFMFFTKHPFGFNVTCKPCSTIGLQRQFFCYGWNMKYIFQVLCLPILHGQLTHSQFLEGLKCESKWKTTKGGRVGARSLAHNTLRGRGACWSSGMGLRRVDKLHSLTQACTQSTQSG